MLPKNNIVLPSGNGSVQNLFFPRILKITCFCPRYDGDLCMQIIAFSTWDEIVPHAESWDRLARGVPFRSWAWLSSWWRHYGPQSPGDPSTRLMVLGVLDTSGRLAGIAPWYLKRSAAKGWVLRWLGSGEVCSDYASILCMPEDADRVTEALAAYLTGSNCASGAPSLLGPPGSRRRGRGRLERHAALAAA